MMHSTFTITLLFISLSIFASTDNKNVVKASIDCPKMIQQVTPCYDFLIRKIPEPSSTCCTSIASFVDILQAPPDDQKAACECLKEAATKNKVDLIKVLDLTQECHLLPPGPLGSGAGAIDCSAL